MKPLEQDDPIRILKELGVGFTPRNAVMSADAVEGTERHASVIPSTNSLRTMVRA